MKNGKKWRERMKIEKMVIALPLENILSTIFKIIDRSYYKTQITHYNKWKPITSELHKNFNITQIETVWFMTLILVIQPKKKR